MARYAGMQQAADYLGLSVRTMTRLRERGLVPSSNPTGGHVIFDLDELDAWVEAAKDPRPAARTAEEYAAAVKAEARNRRRRLKVAS